MLTPRSKPSRLTRMKSSAVPWNQVAIMRPSSCQTVRKRSQSPASRQTDPVLDQVADRPPVVRHLTPIDTNGYINYTCMAMPGGSIAPG